jgi:hypothetical protein
MADSRREANDRTAALLKAGLMYPRETIFRAASDVLIDDAAILIAEYASIDPCIVRRLANYELPFTGDAIIGDEQWSIRLHYDRAERGTMAYVLAIDVRVNGEHITTNDILFHLTDCFWLLVTEDDWPEVTFLADQIVRSYGQHNGNLRTVDAMDRTLAGISAILTAARAKMVAQTTCTCKWPTDGDT